MAFRFRRSIGPKGLKLNITKNGISSVSLGGRGLKYNIPVNRKGGDRITVGIPGSGMSWSEQSSGNNRSSNQGSNGFRSDSEPVRTELVTPLPVKRETIRPTPARPDPIIKQLERQGLDVMEELKSLPEDQWLDHIKAFGVTLVAQAGEHDFPDNNWRSDWVLDFYQWMNDEMLARAEFNGEISLFAEQQQLKARQSKRYWERTGFIVALLIVYASVLAVFNLAAHKSQDSNRQSEQQRSIEYKRFQ